MYRAVIVVLCSLFLLQSCVQGMSLWGKRRCSCKGPGANSVDIKQIKTMKVFRPSSKCEKMEIAVTLKRGTRAICLNPDSRTGKRLLELAKKKSSGE